MAKRYLIIDPIASMLGTGEKAYLTQVGNVHTCTTDREKAKIFTEEEAEEFMSEDFGYEFEEV